MTGRTRIVLGSSKVVGVASGRVENSCVKFVSWKACAKLLEGFWITFIHFGLAEHPVLIPWRKINVIIFDQYYSEVEMQKMDAPLKKTNFPSERS